MNANHATSISFNRRTGGGAAVATIAHAVDAVRRATSEWPWPLPADSVLLMLEDRAAVVDALDELTGVGVQPQDIWMASGTGGARRLREARARRGVLARLAGLIADEDELMAAVESCCARGAAVLLVRAPRDGVDDVLGVVRRHGGRVLRRTGRWTFTGSGASAPQGRAAAATADDLDGVPAGVRWEADLAR